MDIGNQLLKFRKRLGLSQGDLAKELGVSERTLRCYEKNKYPADVNILSKFIKAYDLNPIWLFTDDGPMFIGELTTPASEVPLKPQVKNLIEDVENLKEKILQLSAKIEAEEGDWLSDEVKIDIPEVPLVSGQVSCGIPSVISDREIVDRVKSQPGIKVDFVIKTKGNSMVKYGIADGMLLHIKAQSVCDPGDLVVLAIYEAEDPQLVLKKAHREGGRTVFRNGRGAVFEVTENTEIIGKAVYWEEDCRKEEKAA